MLAGLSATQLAEWQAYGQLEPFGEERGDVRMAILASLIANANRDPKVRSTPFTFSDFLPNFGGEDQGPAAPTQSPEQLSAAVRHLNALLGGSES